MPICSPRRRGGCCPLAEVEHDDRELVLHAQARWRWRPSPSSPRAARRCTRSTRSARRSASSVRVGRVHAVDLRALQDRVRADLERSLRGARVGGEERDAETGGEDHHAALLEVPDRAQGMYGSAICAIWIAVCTRVATCDLLERVLQRERVHHGGEHPHVVGAASGRCRAPAGPARCCRHRRRPRSAPRGRRRRRAAGRAARSARVDAVAGVGGGEGVAGELQEDAVVRWAGTASSVARSLIARRIPRRPSLRLLAELVSDEPTDGNLLPHLRADLVEQLLDRLRVVLHVRLVQQDGSLIEGLELALDDLRRSRCPACRHSLACAS